MRYPLKVQLQRQQELQAWINQYTDFVCDALQMVSGDASFRRYFRFYDPTTNQWIIAVDAPPEFEDCSTFISVAKRYQAAGITVPVVYAFNLQLGFYCQQDFGDNQFYEALDASSCQQLYQQALAQIPKIQTCIDSSKGPMTIYDEAFVQRELDLFVQWLVDSYLHLSLSESEKNLLINTFDLVKGSFLSQPTAGVHRDYHCRNLMILDDGSVGVIDFQDAVIGPITYDAVSLLRDCYLSWPVAMIDSWLKQWHAQYYAQYDWPTFKYWFDVSGIQRHIKVAGIFARLYIRDHKTGYLADIPRTLQYIIDVAKVYPEFAEFSQFVSEKILPAVINKQQGDVNGN
jgi:aminoglycoside/choline kinase family phosphotransferase